MATSTVIVDYAHTPDGLAPTPGSTCARCRPTDESSRSSVAAETATAPKRPEMGRVASTLSDVTIVTSDNPRSESPDAIIDAIMSGVLEPARTSFAKCDRRRAIAGALDVAQPGDVVVIAGKGHETTQIIGDVVVAFDDRDVARELLR